MARKPNIRRPRARLFFHVVHPFPDLLLRHNSTIDCSLASTLILIIPLSLGNPKLITFQQPNTRLVPNLAFGQTDYTKNGSPCQSKEKKKGVRQIYGLLLLSLGRNALTHKSVAHFLVNA